ncbi:MAG: hypothetical protein K1060chlam1_00763 [Candidatus Anoxychlamydiales bacterium]|nr:hypothetical protein [Candidatus Anoxychlamydiales bacterium]
MVFWVESAFALSLIALALGGSFLFFIKTHKSQFSFGKFIAYFVIILAFFSMACTTYYGTKYWFQGYYEKPISYSKHKLFKKSNGLPAVKEHKKERKYPKKEEY